VDSNRAFYIGDNTTSDMAPITNVGDANEGEQILFEDSAWPFAASPTGETSVTATFASPPPTQGFEYGGQPINSRDAMIIEGRGAGQTRHVTNVSGNTITISPAWLVVPDATSVIGVGPGQFQAVVYHNTLDGKSNYSTYETASVGMEMYGNISDVIFANNILTHMRQGVVTEYSQVPSSHEPYPSSLYFNLVTNNSLNGSYNGISQNTDFVASNNPGILGHIGNSYRANTLTNIVSTAIHFEPEYQSYTGGDFDQNIYEHNTATNVPIAIGMTFPSWAFQNVTVSTIFANLGLYKNTFTLGTATFSGSKQFSLKGSTTNFWRAGNTFTGFETASTTDPNTPPTATVIDNTAPTVSLTAPSNGATVSGSSVAISATASDNVSVAGVQFKLDTNAPIGSEDTSSPYSVTWDSTGVADGSHTIVAVARDTYGNYATSSLITLTVHNALPTPVSYGGGGPIYGSGPLAPGYQVVVPTITTPSISSSTSAVSIPSSTTSNKGIILTKNHQIWDRGKDILTLQKWLNAHGFIIALAGPGSPGSETSIFGTLTYKTLIRFQNSKALPPTGYLGPLTRALINSLAH
jgi:hypothetical protein